MHKFSKNLKNFQKVLDKSKLMCYNKDNKDTEKETLKNQKGIKHYENLLF